MGQLSPTRLDLHRVLGPRKPVKEQSLKHARFSADSIICCRRSLKSAASSCVGGLYAVASGISTAVLTARFGEDSSAAAIRRGSRMPQPLLPIIEVHEDDEFRVGPRLID